MPVSGSLLIDDCEDGDSTNLLGGAWYAYDDMDLGLTNASSNVASYDFMDANGCTVSASGAAKITNQRIFTSVTSPLGGYYGFTGMYTTVTYPADISSYTGIKFFAYCSVSTTPVYARDIHFSFALGSKTEEDLGIKSRYRKEFVITEPNEWQQFTVPFSGLTQGFAYDSYYGSHPQAVTGVVKEVKRFQWDMVAISGSNNSQWSDVFMIDHVELY